MTVTNVHKDHATLTMTIRAEFVASIERVWQMWENPRLLERWWGPPTYPATFTDHDLTPGGRAAYFMTGPEGDTPGGWWRVLAVDAPHSLSFENGFADQAGEPDANMPVTRITATLAEDSGGRVHMAIETVFPSVDVMDQLVSMGMDEGMSAAMGQIDELLVSDSVA